MCGATREWTRRSATSAARDPPDAANCKLPVWKLIPSRKLYPLNEALDSPPTAARTRPGGNR